MSATKKFYALHACALLALAGCGDATAAGSGEALRAEIEACVPATIAGLRDAERMERCLDRIPRASVPPEEVYGFCFSLHASCVASNTAALCSPIFDECFGTVHEERNDPERNLSACYGAGDECLVGETLVLQCLAGLEGCVDALDRRVPDIYEDTILQLCEDEHTRCLSETDETIACGEIREACLDYVEDDSEDDN